MTHDEACTDHQASQAHQALLTKLRLLRRWMTVTRRLKWVLYALAGLPVWWLYETQSLFAIFLTALVVNLALATAYVQGYCEGRYEALEEQAREFLDA